MLTESNPQRDIERQLREQVYSAILPGQTVRSDDDFFELGGDSIGLIRAVALAQQVFGVEVSARSFFMEPTLAALADAISGAMADLASEAAVAEVLDSIADLTDDEVRQALTEEPSA